MPLVIALSQAQPLPREANQAVSPKHRSFLDRSGMNHPGCFLFRGQQACYGLGDIAARNTPRAEGLAVKLKAALQGLVRAVVEEAERSPQFAKRLETALGLTAIASASARKSSAHAKRRTPAVLDPIDLARQGEHTLRQTLGTLNLDQLKAIVADYRMEIGKPVRKWKTPQRIIDRIVEVSLARAVKGGSSSITE
jgi:hypothetical protein